MRRVFFAAVLAVVVVAAFAVLYSGVTDTYSPFSTTSTLVNQDVSASVNLNASPPQNHITASNNAFAMNFYKQVSGDSVNIFFSPTSIYTAFSLLHEGARNNTAEEIRNVFEFETNVETRHNDTAYMMSSINRDDQYVDLNIANALWLAEWFKALPSYIDVAQGVYLADVQSVELDGDKRGVKQINDWASANTNGKIDEIITDTQVDEETAMIITNAVYFKGTWVNQFEEERTAESDFWKDGVASVRANFMNQRNIFNYTSSNGVQVLKMPYVGDRMSMLVILPEDRNGIRALEELLSNETIRKWNQDMLWKRVVVSIPKFTFEQTYDLIPFLKKLGMVDVFDRYKSDLTGIISSPNLFVDKALQKSFVEVNEVGTEAAVVTAEMLSITSEQPPPLIFTADHPFIFLIQDDESGAILFMGRVSDPT